MSKDGKIRGKYAVLNPNRLAIDMILVRLKAMKGEIEEIIDMVEDMVWNTEYEERYKDAVESLKIIYEQINDAIEYMIDILEIEPPGW